MSARDVVVTTTLRDIVVGCSVLSASDRLALARELVRAAGFVVVPVEPDCDMLQAGYDAGRAARSSGVGGMTIDNQIKMQCYREGAIYRAMLAAAQEAPDDTVRIGAATLAKLADAAETQIIGSYPNAVLYPPQRKAMEAELAPVREAREALRAVTDCSTAAAPRHP